MTARGVLERLQLGAIGERPPLQELQDLLIALCMPPPWRVKEMVDLLGCKAETLRENILCPLRPFGPITVTRTDETNDQEPAYRASAAA